MAFGTNEINEPVGENTDMMEFHEASESSVATDDEEQVLILAKTYTLVSRICPKKKSSTNLS